MEAHGTIHWLRHKDGPSRVVEGNAGVRARLPRPLTDGRIAYVADHDGDGGPVYREIAPQVPAPSGCPGSKARQADTRLPRTSRGGQPEAQSPVAPLPSPSQPPAVAGPRVDAAVADDARRRRSRAGTEKQHGRPADRHCGPPVQQSARIAFPKPSRASAMEASPDGRWIAVGTAFGDVYVADARDGA